MHWKEQLKKLEDAKTWDAAITLMQDVIERNPADVDAYTRAIYLLHDVLLEHNYPMDKRPPLQALLTHYFELSQKMFSDNAEYLFFVGKIIYIAEWYFGLDDDLKPIQEKAAFKMQKKAFEMEKENALFECTYRFSLHDPRANELAKQALCDPKKVEWLESKGYPGEYVLAFLNQITEDAR